jgi:hypothetical protein
MISQKIRGRRRKRIKYNMKSMIVIFNIYLKVVIIFFLSISHLLPKCFKMLPAPPQNLIPVSWLVLHVLITRFNVYRSSTANGFESFLNVTKECLRNTTGYLCQTAILRLPPQGFYVCCDLPSEEINVIWVWHHKAFMRAANLRN